MAFVVLSEDQRAHIAHAARTKQHVSFIILPAQMKARSSRLTVTLPLTAAQREVYEACRRSRQPYEVSLAPHQLRGGFISTIIELAKQVLPKLAIPALSALVQVGVRRAFEKPAPPQKGTGIAAEAKVAAVSLAAKNNPLNPLEGELVMGRVGETKTGRMPLAPRGDTMQGYVFKRPADPVALVRRRTLVAPAPGPGVVARISQ